MSEIKVNKISPRTACGTTTLGDSGDTFTIPAGVTITNNGTQTGFGRNGTVNWQTSIKTTAFTAVSGEGYFCDTNTSGAFAVTLPASPSAGDIVAVADYANTFDTASLTLNRNGSNIEGEASNLLLNVEGAAITVVYADATKGWIVTESGNSTDGNSTRFITATGGNTVATCGNFKIHTFTGPGTFCVSCSGNTLGSNTVDYLVIAGGASGGGGSGAGGGGAGGYRESSGAASGCYSRSPLGACVSALPVSVQGYPITVGAGGAAQTSSNKGNDGSNSIFATITSAGGGAGGGENVPTKPGNNGGSGGGGQGNPSSISGGAGNTPPVSPPQGNNGGNGVTNYAGGGGGGAGGVGGTGPNPAGAGGAGATSSINGTPTARAGGGGGGQQPPAGCGPGPATAGGGAGGVYTVQVGQAATANTGGGGGGAAFVPSGPTHTSGTGGSGIVIIRYKFQ
jgi:hypothetical protein